LKLLIVGADNELALERYYTNHLINLGNEVHLFPSQNILQSVINSNFLKRIQHRIRPSDIYKNINVQLLNFAEQINPDIIWVFKGMELFPRTISQLKQHCQKVVNYNPDHPFIKSSRASLNSNVTKSVGLYDFHFVYSKQLGLTIKQKYGLDHTWLPFGYEKSLLPSDLLESNEDIHICCFVANADKTRAQKVKMVLDAGYEVHVYGDYWNRYIKSSENLTIFPRVDAYKYWKTLRKYRIQFNIFRLHNLGSHNMRTFEIPAVGGIMLAPRNSEHLSFFKEDDEAFYFNGDEEFLKKIQTILNLSHGKSNKIRESAIKKSQESGNTYQHRAEMIEKVLTSLIY